MDASTPAHADIAVTCRSEADTRVAAATLAALLQPGDVVLLRGDLGAGKTLFTRAACRALGVPREAGVSSPSYSLVNLYDGGELPVAHLDLYRLEDEDELEAIGFRDLLDSGRVLFVEWPERAPMLREVATFEIELARDPGGDPEHRELRLTALDSQAQPGLVLAFASAG